MAAKIRITTLCFRKMHITDTIKISFSTWMTSHTTVCLYKSWVWVAKIGMEDVTLPDEPYTTGQMPYKLSILERICQRVEVGLYSISPTSIIF